MAEIRDIEVQSYTHWINGRYVDASGQEYEVVFTRSYDENIGYESRELVNVEKDGAAIDSDDPIWKEIQEQMQTVEFEETPDYKNIQFKILIDKGWLETLESLMEMILNSSQSSPEEALEVVIFSQIKVQYEGGLKSISF